MPIYLADTDGEARRRARPHVEYLFNTLLRMPRDMFFPAGYLTPESAVRVLGAKGGLGSGGSDPDDLMDHGYVLAGSPATIRERLEALRDELGFGTLVGVFQFGSVTNEEFLGSVGLFAEEVMPAFRAASGAADVASLGSVP